MANLKTGVDEDMLFEMYVFAVTSEDGHPPKRVYPHFLLPYLAVLVGLLVAAAPQNIAAAIASEAFSALSGCQHRAA